MFNNLLSRYHILPERDQNALKILVVFFMCLLIYGVYALHVKANKVQTSALAVQKQYFWLRSQVNNIQTSAMSAEKAKTIISESAERQNIVLSFGQKNQQSVQAMHENAVVLGSFLANLDAQGIQISQLTMKQTSDTITANLLVDNL